MATVAELLQPVESDLEALLSDLRSLIGAGHPILQAAAEHLFSAGGKRLRPAIVLLISRALAPQGELTSRHRRLAEITELIHTASLVHDDVVDEASTRRGVDTVHSRFNHRVAVLAGDFLFAQASWHLANLDNLEVVKLPLPFTGHVPFTESAPLPRLPMVWCALGRIMVCLCVVVL